MRTTDHTYAGPGALLPASDRGPSASLHRQRDDPDFISARAHPRLGVGAIRCTRVAQHDAGTWQPLVHDEVSLHPSPGSASDTSAGRRYPRGGGVTADWIHVSFETCLYSTPGNRDDSIDS